MRPEHARTDGRIALGGFRVRDIAIHPGCDVALPGIGRIASSKFSLLSHLLGKRKAQLYEPLPSSPHRPGHQFVHPDCWGRAPYPARLCPLRRNDGAGTGSKGCRNSELHRNRSDPARHPDRDETRLRRFRSRPLCLATLPPPSPAPGRCAASAASGTCPRSPWNTCMPTGRTFRPQ